MLSNAPTPRTGASGARYPRRTSSIHHLPSVNGNTCIVYFGNWKKRKRGLNTG